MSIRLVMADDHPIVLEGLTQLFSLEPDFQVVASARNGDEALEAVRRHQPDIAVLDIRMPGKDGLAVVREMIKLRVHQRIQSGIGAMITRAATGAVNWLNDRGDVPNLRRSRTLPFSHSL